MCVIEGALKGGFHYAITEADEIKIAHRYAASSGLTKATPAPGIIWTGQHRHKPFVGLVVGIDRGVVWLESPTAKAKRLFLCWVLSDSAEGCSGSWWIVMSVAIVVGVVVEDA